MLDAVIRRPRAALPDYDLPLLWAVIIIVAFGLVMVYSSSIAVAEAVASQGQRYTFYLERQTLFVIAGALLGFLAFQFSSREWQKAAPWLFVVGVALLALVLVPGVGREVNGSQRWLSLGFFSLQPSEMMKFFCILYAADYTARKGEEMQSFVKGFLPMMVALLLVGGLVILQPDFGSVAVISALALIILFLGGMGWKHFIAIIGLLAVGFVGLILSSPYRMKRIVGFMNPWDDPFGKGYQLSHALMAFGRGEFFGVGLGGSVEKLLYLPEAHTDFILAVIAEELGFAGVALVVAGFAFITWRAFQIGRRAADQDRNYAALVAYGVGSWLAVQSIINMGVNVGLLPTKGLTLPLMSYGGSGIVANCMAIGVLLRVDWENRQVLKGYTV